MRGGTVQINWHDTKPVLTLDFHSPSGLLATGGNDHDIKLWAIMDGGLQKKAPTVSYKSSLCYHSSAVNILRFSPSGGYLASGADGGDLVLWRLHSSDDGSSWKVLKTLSFHRKDVLDLQWSADGSFLITGSIDNSCIIWDVNKGSVHQILDAHLHYVQGVAWDPLGKFVASLSSDRTCRIYVHKPQAKMKGLEKLNYVCQHVITKSEPQKQDDPKSQLPKNYLFHDDTLPSFFRRLAWSPDGSFLLVPAGFGIKGEVCVWVVSGKKAWSESSGLDSPHSNLTHIDELRCYDNDDNGIYKLSPSSETLNTAYVFSRKDLSKPAVQLRGASGPIVAVRFCPIIFSLCGSNSATLFKLPYRVVFAVATLNSLYVYDTESSSPIAILAGLHYAAVTDIAWSSDARYLALSSRDGFCTLLEFENNELGSPVSFSDAKHINEENAILGTAKTDVADMEVDNVEPGVTDKGADLSTDEVKQASTTSANVSGATKPTKKRITPIAIVD